MGDINSWLEKQTSSILDMPFFAEEKAEFRDAAKTLVERGEADGYSVAEIKDACGGDVETFLLERQNTMTEAEMKNKIADDPFV